MRNFNQAYRATNSQDGLSLEAIKRYAPSVYAETPFGGMSEKYRFVPTFKVVEGLVKNDFVPVYAGQSSSRIEGKKGFTRHVMRFRHRSLINEAQEVPEIVLLNSHDGSSSYQLNLGFFRTVCANGLIVQSAGIDAIRVRHSGREDIIGEVIEGSYKIIDEAPKVMDQINQWKALQLTSQEQEVFAKTAIELRDSALEISPGQVLSARRGDDLGRDLWKTMNVIQENLVRGGTVGRDANNRLRRVRAVKGVDADTKLNRALWQLTEEMARIKNAA